MSRDRTVGETFYLRFTTRAFATGIPTTLSGTPVVSAYEDGSVTQITAGITLGVDHDSVTGLNLLTIVATGANGFETGKDYDLVITTGTVGGVSVVGEVVGQFSLGLSAAFTRIGAAGAGLTNINLPNQTMDITGNLSGSVGSVTGAVGSVTGHTAQTGDTYALANGAAGFVAIDTVVDSILVDTADMQPKLGSPAADLAADLAAVKVDTAATLVDTAEIGAAGAGLTALASAANLAALNDISVADILTTQMTEAYSADGAAPTITQSLMLIQQTLGDFAIAGTTLTVKKVDGSTTAATFTLDSATAPTSITRAT